MPFEKDVFIVRHLEYHKQMQQKRNSSGGHRRRCVSLFVCLSERRSMNGAECRHGRRSPRSAFIAQTHVPCMESRTSGRHGGSDGFAQRSAFWYPSHEYDPIAAGSIDGTDITAHDKAILRAVNACCKFASELIRSTFVLTCVSLLRR